MAECIILKGGGGADLDVVTAGTPDVLTGKVIVDKNGEPLTGTMPDRGATNQSLGINDTYLIPEGYHNGSGKVTQNIATMSGQTVNPTASQQIVSTNGKYLTGNVTVNGVSNLTAANIKKGVNVGGTVGTFSGYVASTTDLYLRGNNIKNWSPSNGILESGQITIGSSSVDINALSQITLTGFTYLNIEGYTNQGVNSNKEIGLFRRPSSTIGAFTRIATVSLGSYGAGNYTYSVNVSAIQITTFLTINLGYLNGVVYRIWLS